MRRLALIPPDSSKRSVARAAWGLVAFGGALLAAVSCQDLTSPQGLDPATTITWLTPVPDTDGIIKLKVQQALAPNIEVAINGRAVARARYFFTSTDPNVIGVSATGDLLTVKSRGQDTIIVTLAGATLGDTSVRSDTVLVSVNADSNFVTPANVNVASLGDTTVLRAFSLDANGKKIAAAGGNVRFRSSDTTRVFVTDSTGQVDPSDSTARFTRIVARANGSATVTSVFEGSYVVTTSVTVQQFMSRVEISSRFGSSGAPISMRALTAKDTVRMVPKDALGNIMPLPPGLQFTQTNPNIADVAMIGAGVGVVTAKGNNLVGTVANVDSIFITGLQQGQTGDKIPVFVTQVAVSPITITDPASKALTLPSRGATATLDATVKDSLGQTLADLSRITWTSLDPLRVRVVKAANTGQIQGDSVTTGAVKVVASVDGVSDTVLVTVTNNPASLRLLPDSVEIKALSDTFTFLKPAIKNAAGDSLPTVQFRFRSRDTTKVTVDSTTGFMTALAVTNGTEVLAETKIAPVRADTSKIVVTNHPQTVFIAATTMTLNSLGDTSRVGIVLTNKLGNALGANAATWTTLQPLVALVSSTGLVTANGVGSTSVIAASPVPGGPADTIDVVVNNSAASVSVSTASATPLTAFGATASYTATVKNSAGVTLSGASVKWTSSNTGVATIDSLTGVATAVGNGPTTITATSGTASGNATLNVGQTISLSQTTITASPTSITADGVSTSTITVQLKDANGNNYTNTAPLAPVLTTTAGAITAQPTGGAGGTWTGTLTSSTTIGTATVSGTVNSQSISASNNAIVSFTAGTATKYAVTSTNFGPVAGTSVTISAQLQDVNSNPVQLNNQPVNWTSGGVGSFSPGTTSNTNASGVATITFTTSTTVGTQNVTATTGGLTGTTNPSITTIAGTAQNYLVTAGSTSPAAGSKVLVSAQLRDANSNAVRTAGVTVTWGKSNVNGSFTAPTSQTDANGVATDTLVTHTVSGTATTVDATSPGPITGTSTTITTVAGAASQLSVVQAPSATPQSGIAFPTQPTIQLLDANSNLVSQPNITVSVAITSGGGTLSGTTQATTNGSGLASFVGTGLTISGTVGARTLTFTSNGLNSTTAGVTLAAGNAATIAVNSGNNQSVTAGSAVTPPSVLVTDASGNPVSTVGVTFAVGIGGGIVGGGAQSTNGSGVATVGSWTLGTTAGTNTMTATSAGLSGSPLTFTATGTVGAATSFTINGGDGQTATAGSNVATAPSAIVRDVNNNPVSGVNVTFAVTGGGGSISSPTGATVATNAQGIAMLSTWTLGTLAGANSLQASAAVAGSPLTFTANAVAGSAQNVIATSTTTQSVTAGAAATAPAVKVRDANNNPVSGVTVTFALVGGAASGSVTGSLTPTTDVNGNASLATWTTNTVVGTNSITTTVGTLSGSPITFTATTTPGAANNVITNSTTSQSATVGTNVAAPPSVIVRDVNSNPVAAGVSVTFTVTAAQTGGVVNGGATANVNTNSSGVATLTTWTLGTDDGTNSVDVTVGATTVTFNATGTAGAASQLTVTQAPPASVQSDAVFTPAVTLQLRDANSNLVTTQNVIVNATLTSGTGTLGGTTTVQTNSSGVATFSNLKIAGLIGAKQITFSSSGLTSPAPSSVTITHGDARVLALTATPPATVTNGVDFSTQPVVEVRDGQGNVVTTGAGATTTVTAAITTGNGVLSATDLTNDAIAGVSTFAAMRITGLIGDRTITFSATGLTSTTANVTVIAGAVTSFTVEAAAGGNIPLQIATIPFSIKVTARDVSSNVATSFVSTVAITSTTGATFTSGGGTTAALTSGVLASHSVTISNAGAAHSITATRTSGAETGVSNTFDVRAATKYVVTPTSTSVTVGSSQLVTAQLADAGNNPVAIAGRTVSWSSSGTGGSFSTPTSLTDANGQAVISFTASTDPAQSHIVTATDNTGLTGNSASIAIIPNITAMTGPANGTYGIGQNLNFTVTWGEAVTVAGGPPQISLTIGSTTRQAAYFSGSGTATLTFRYTVQAGDDDANGIAFQSMLIGLNGGTIRDVASTNAALDFTAFAPTLTGVLTDGTAPTISSMTGPANGTYGIGENLDFTVTWNENVTVVGGPPQISLTIGSTTRQAAYLSGSGTATLTFRYTVQAGDDDANGIAFQSMLIGLNGGTIKDAGNSDAALDFTAFAPTLTGVLTDGTLPTITGGTLAATNAFVDVAFSEPVYTNNTGSGALTTGDFSLTFTQNGGSATNVTILSVTTTAGGGLAGGETTVRVNLTITGTPSGVETVEIKPASGSAIFDFAGNAMDAAQTTGVKTLNDQLAPSITAMTGPANGTYGIGQNLDFTVTWSENVTVVGGPPRISLTIGSTTQQANYLSGSGTSTLTFRYTVQSGDDDADGIAFQSMLIGLNGGTIRDAAANNAALDFTAFAPALTSVLTDGTLPTITSGTLAANNAFVDVAFSEPVYTNNTGSGALTTGDFSLTFTQNGGSATNVTILSVTTTAGGGLAGGETTVRVNLTITGTPSGVETVEIKPASGSAIFDFAGNAMDAAQTTGVKTLNDQLAPSITAMTGPANGTYGIGQNLDFTVTWSENVTVVGGPPQISLTIGATTRQADYLSGSGGPTLTFRYTVQTGDDDGNGIAFQSMLIGLNGGTIRDAAANNAALDFTAFAPTLTGVLTDGTLPTFDAANSTPADNGFIPVANNIVLDFSETVVAGTGNIELRRTSDNALIEAFDVVTDAGTGAGQVQFAADKVTLNPTASLVDGVEYYVLVDATAVDDAAGNSFAGIVSTTIYSFTADGTLPTITTSTIPANNAYIEVNVSEAVYTTVVNGGGSGALTTADFSIAFVQNGGGATNATISGITNTSGGALVGGESAVRLTLNITGTPTGVETIEITPASGAAIFDRASNAMSGAQTTGAQLLLDQLAPTFDAANSTPADNGFIPVANNVVLDFSQTVVAGTGNIELRRTSDDALIESFDVVADAGTGAGQVQFAADKVTLNPTASLVDGVEYYVLVDATAVDDAAGNSFAGIASTTTYSFTADGTLPTITTSTIPANNAYIEVNVSEAVYTTVVNGGGSGALTTADFSIAFVQNGGGATNATISGITNTSGGALVGGESAVRLTLNITGTPSGVETVEATPASGAAIFDRASNAMSAAETTGAKLLNDQLAPTFDAANSTPADNGFIPVANNVVLDFSETVVAGTGNIELRRTSDDALIESFDVVADAGTGAGQVSVAADKVTLNPTASLVDGVEYYVLVDATAVDDAAGNSFAGIASTTTYSFTADGTLPTITGGTVGAANAYLQVNISEGVYTTVVNGGGSGALTTADFTLNFVQNGGTATNATISGITNTSGGALVGGETAVRLTLNITGTPSGVETVEATPASGAAIFDRASNAMSGAQTTGAQLLLDQLAPTFDAANSTPADNGFIPVANNVVLDFSETVVAGTGNIELRRTSDDALIESFDVVADAGTGAGQVSVAADKVTLNPTASLVDGVEYYVLVDATAVDDAAGNSFAGIASTTTYSFTADGTLPTITSGTLALSNAYVDVTFSEGVYTTVTNGAGTGALTTGDFSLTFVQNGGNATAASITGVTNTSGGALTGGEATIRVNISFTGVPSGAETVEITPFDGASIYDRAGNAALATETTNALTAYAPTITGATVGAASAFIDVTFSEGVYNTNLGTGALTTGSFSLAFLQNTGTATNVTILSVTTTGGGSLSGGETTVRINLTVTGAQDGNETIEVKPADGSSIYNATGNAMAAAQTTGQKNLVP